MDLLSGNGIIRTARKGADEQVVALWIAISLCRNRGCPCRRGGLLEIRLLEMAAALTAVDFHARLRSWEVRGNDASVKTKGT